MSGFMNIIHTVGVDPRAWIVLALFAARAIWSIVSLSRVSARAGAVSAAATSDSDRMLSWRFPATMVVGIALAIIGLFRLSHGAAQPAFALFLLLLGVYLFTTEPVRRQIAIAELRLREATGGPGEDVAITDYRESQLRLIVIEVLIVAVLLAGMLTL
jgi:hypothetical protein